MRDVYFVVARGDGHKLAAILEDPVNRRGSDHDDEEGTFSYYADGDEEFTAVDELTADYEIFEVAEDGTVTLFDPEAEPECPELGKSERSELEAFCLYRTEGGHCEKLGIPCVILDD
jgi:hypothetical protein